MRFCINDVIYSLSYALDCVEHDLVGVATHHGLRVACLSILLGREEGFCESQLLDLASCAILHDNALTEYMQSEMAQGLDVLTQPEKINLGVHCRLGERNITAMPFQNDVTGAILYHHEKADGTGPFGKTEQETPLMAQFIHMGDQLDIRWNLGSVSDEKFQQILEFLKRQSGKMFSEHCIQLFLNACNTEMLQSLKPERVMETLRQLLPQTFYTYSKEEIFGMCNVFASIIDYKSKFTRIHSLGVAQKSAAMGTYFGCSEEEITKLYFAGTFHDIGKLVVDRDILEKPDKLTNQEFVHMKNHAYFTYVILNQIDGLEDITSWASLHHEKLDGSGYPFGKKAEELGRNERLLACIDIYQALTEKRPYKDGMSHEEAIAILRKMAAGGLLDPFIVEAIFHAFLQDSQ